MVRVLVGVIGCIPRPMRHSLVTLFSLSVSVKDRPGLRSGGLESKFGRGHEPLDRRVVDWSYLCLGYKWGVCFGVPS